MSQALGSAFALRFPQDWGISLKCEMHAGWERPCALRDDQSKLFLL